MATTAKSNPADTIVVDSIVLLEQQIAHLSKKAGATSPQPIKTRFGNVDWDRYAEVLIGSVNAALNQINCKDVVEDVEVARRQKGSAVNALLDNSSKLISLRSKLRFAASAVE